MSSSRLWLAVSTSCLLVLSWSSLALAASGSSANVGSQSISNAVAQSFNAAAGTQTGMLVEYQPKEPGTVMPLLAKDAKSLLGVVIPATNTAIVLTPTTVTNQQVLVATTGQYQVLVSNQNGPIKSGDYITISSVAGVGMKATSAQTEVVGQATGSFSGDANVVSSVKLKNSTGQSFSVAVGSVPLNISIMHNPLYQPAATVSSNIVVRTASSIVGKPVDPFHVYLAIAILLAAIYLAGNMLYSGVRSSLQAIGRNPLSKKSIIRGLIETVIGGLSIFIVGVVAVYLLLKL